MNWVPIAVIARKELSDGFRDRRSIYTMLVTALFGPLLIFFMLNQQTSQTTAAKEIRIPVAGIDFAPVLVNWLQQQPGVEVLAGPTDPEAAVRDGRAEMVLVIKQGFADQFCHSKPATVQLFSDSTRKTTAPKLRRLAGLLNRFNEEIGAARLTVRGVSPDVANPLRIEAIDLASSQQRAATLLDIVLLFLIIAAITGGMQIATDSTAGERERGSLEPLLINPVPRWQIVSGKWLAAVLSASVGMAATLAAIFIALRRLPLEDLGVRFYLSAPKVVLLIAAMSPLALMIPAIQIYLSSFAKSFKEAQSYTVLLVLPVGFIGLISTFYPVTDRPWMQAIPVLAQYSFGTDILAGKRPSLLALTAGGIEAVTIAAIFVWLAARLFSTEEIIFGR